MDITDDGSQELLLQKLQELVYDEDQCVTCFWLSNKLVVDVDKARELLKTFVDDRRSVKPDDLAVTYIISGTLKDTSEENVSMVNEDDLESKKRMFDGVPSDYIYSVQKCKKIDFNVIAMVDVINSSNLKETPILGSVIGKNCIKRKLKVKQALPVVNRSANVDKAKASHLFTKPSTSNNEIKKEASVKDEIMTKTESSIKEEKKTENTSKPDKKLNKTKPVQKGGITSFFSKGPLKPIEPIKVKEEEVKKEETVMEVDDMFESPIPNKKEAKRTGKIDLCDSDTDEEAKKIEEVNKKKSEETTNGNKKQTKRMNSKRQRKDTSVEQPQKKRKRIVERHDSDSDDMFGDEPVEMVESSEDEPMQREPPKSFKPVNQKRKLVYKEYEDEDGYIVTEKEFVYETGSEDEETKEQKNPQLETKQLTQPKKKELIKAPAKDLSPTKPAKGKKNAKGIAPNQKTLMDFFKKA